MPVCCYVCFCPCCAAGDVATAAKRDYCMSCCIVPMLCPIWPCWMAYDRQALVAQYNIEDGFSGVAPALFCLGCHGCMLCQELNFIKHATITGIVPGQATGSTIVIGQQAMTY